MINKTKIIVLLLFTFTVSFGQTCGFGCLGLSGAFGGFTYQSYEADGLNEYILNKLGSRGDDFTFTEGKGFRIGGNIVRAKFDDYFFTAKGFYQFSKESKDFVGDVTLNQKESYEFKLNFWGIGVDLGIPVCDFIDLKILDGGITFIQADYEEKKFVDGAETSFSKYENNDSEIGYYIGSGLIIHLMEDYVSLEGTAAYTRMKISNMINDSGNKLLSDDSPDLLSKGGMLFNLQLNIGFPL